MKITKRNNPIKIKKISKSKSTLFYDLHFLEQFYGSKRIKIKRVIPAISIA